MFSDLHGDGVSCFGGGDLGVMLGDGYEGEIRDLIIHDLHIL